MANRSAYDGGRPYGRRADTYPQDPYDPDAEDDLSDVRAQPASAYARQGSPYGAQPQRGRVYAEGRGRAYTSSRRSGAVGVRPVSRDEYIPGGSPMGGGNARVTRRRVIVAGACSLLGIAALGVGGAAWWANRTVLCQVNGVESEVRIGSSAQDLIDAGLASPAAGNLVSICVEGETPEVLVVGGGNPYELTVNGEQVDPDSYRVSEDDVIEFADGTDVTEDVSTQTTIAPCGVQFRTADGELIDPNEATSRPIYLAPIGYVAQWGLDGVSSVDTGVVSGRVIDRGVTTEAQDLIVCAGHVNPVADRLLIAITFDDGPDPTYTPQYLDILAQYGAKATFFNIGTSIDAYPELSQRVVSEGHQLASHTYSHMNLLSVDTATMQQEIATAFDSIATATGVQTNVVRPPYGNFLCKQFLQTIGQVSCSAYWTVDSLDWDYATQIDSLGASGVGSQIVTQVTKGLSGSSHNGAIILMHDGGGNRAGDVVALPTILSTFQAAGYEFVTLNDMIAADPAIPSWVGADQAACPEGYVIPDLSAYV